MRATKWNLAAVAAAMTIVGVGCAADPGDDGSSEIGSEVVAAGANDPNPARDVATRAPVTVGMVTLFPEMKLNDGEDPADVKPGFEVELFSESVLAPLATASVTHDNRGLVLKDGELVVVNFAPVKAIQERRGTPQLAFIALSDAPASPAIADDHLYRLPTEWAGTAPVKVCRPSPLVSQAEVASMEGAGALGGANLVDTTLHGAVLRRHEKKDAASKAEGRVKIKLRAQIEDCPEKKAAKAGDRLCYQKLEELKKTPAGRATQLGNFSGYVKPLLEKGKWATPLCTTNAGDNANR